MVINFTGLDRDSFQVVGLVRESRFELERGRFMRGTGDCGRGLHLQSAPRPEMETVHCPRYGKLFEGFC
jgi:hypothetical protein